jgi:hypothetical protein
MSGRVFERFAQHEREGLLAELLREGIRRQDWALITRARDLLSGAVPPKAWVVYTHNAPSTEDNFELEHIALFFSENSAYVRASCEILQALTLELTIRAASSMGDDLGADTAALVLDEYDDTDVREMLSKAKEAWRATPVHDALTGLSLNEWAKSFYGSVIEVVETQYEQGFPEPVLIMDAFASLQRANLLLLYTRQVWVDVLEMEV